MRNAGCGSGNRKPGKVFSFVAACSNSGKTTLIEKIVPILKLRGLRVAVVKHASGGFVLDQAGKDSWRFQEAGADAVLLLGPQKIALMKKTEHDPDPEEFAYLVEDADIVIHEGFKRTACNTIEVFRSAVSEGRPLCLDNEGYLALVSDKPFDVAIPRFDINDAKGIADFLVKFLN